MNAKEFILQKDAERGQGWSDDAFLLTKMFEEYAAIKVAEATRQSTRWIGCTCAKPVLVASTGGIVENCIKCGLPHRKLVSCPGRQCVESDNLCHGNEMIPEDEIAVLKYKLEKAYRIIDGARWTHRDWDIAERDMLALKSSENDDAIAKILRCGT